jgi:hypothetical protein
MNIKMLIICLEEEKERADELRLLFDKMAIYSGILPAKSKKGGRRSIEKQFFAFFNLTPSNTGDTAQSVDGKTLESQEDTPTHVIIISHLAPEWVDFLAGFSCGSHVPFLAYGEDAKKCVPEVYNFCFKILETQDSLFAYLDSESAALKKKEVDRETQKARNALLEQGIPVNNNSLGQCVAEGRLDDIVLFFGAGFTPDTKDKTGVPLLNIAARAGNYEIVQFLLKAGAPVNLRAEDRDTNALLDSVMGKFSDIITDLIKAGSDVNIQSKDGQTALIVAVGADETEIVEELLKAGANPDISDNMGMSARKYASLFRKTELVNLFNTYAPEKKD